MRQVLIVVMLLVLAASIAAAQEASPWFSELRFSAMKTADLTSIGAGVSINVYRWSAERSAYLDACPIYDLGANLVGGAVGVSTEPRGVPVLETLLAPILSVIDTAGVGGKWLDGEATFIGYVTTHF